LTRINLKASLMKRLPDGEDAPMPFSSFFLLALAIPFLQSSERSGITIIVQSSVGGNQAQRTTYIQPDRQRMEYRNSFGGRHGIELTQGPRLVRIVRCDLGQSFELNLDTQEYTAAPYPPKPLTPDELKARGLDTRIQQPATPTIRVEIKTTDTGERKEIFGRTARHVVTTTTQTPLAGSHSSPQESVADGWYIDFDQQLSCDPKRTGSGHGTMFGYVSVGGGKVPMEKPEFVTIGNREMGFALDLTQTSKSPSNLPDGTVTRFETHVTQFEEGPLDPAVFEIPPGFKQVHRIERNPPPSALGSHP
jgi:hypothetical protein